MISYDGGGRRGAQRLPDRAGARRRKSTVALGVAELLSRRVQRLAVFRPLVRDADDPIVALLRDRYQLAAAGFGTTYAEAVGCWSQPGSPKARRAGHRGVPRGHRRADAAVIIGTDFGQDAGRLGRVHRGAGL